MVVDWVAGILGGLLVLVVVVDATWTVLAAGSGLGPVSRWVVPRVWHLVVRRHHDRHGEDAGVVGHRQLRRIGLTIIGAVLLSLVAALLTGWSLVFQVQDAGLVVPPTNRSADVGERVYFAGFTVFTLGVGDVVPGTGWMRAATIAASATGLLLVTLLITYAVPMLDAYAQKRTLAATVTGLGRTPAEVVVAAWDGETLPMLDDQLGDACQQLSTMAQQHVSYPLLDLLHAEHAEAAVAVAVVVLDEAVTVLELGVVEELRPPPLLLRTARRAVGRYLATAAAVMEDSEDVEVPPPLDLEPLRRNGVPCVDDETWEREVADLADRRRTLRRMLRADGWTWTDVVAPVDEDGERAALPTTDESSDAQTESADDTGEAEGPAPE